MTTAMRRVPQFEDAFAETLVTNVVKLPDRSALEAWNSFDRNFIANPFKQMAEADNVHMTQQQILLQLKKMAGQEGRPLADLHKEYGVHEKPPPGGSAQPPPSTPQYITKEIHHQATHHHATKEIHHHDVHHHYHHLSTEPKPPPQDPPDEPMPPRPKPRPDGGDEANPPPPKQPPNEDNRPLGSTPGFTPFVATDPLTQPKPGPPSPQPTSIVNQIIRQGDQYHQHFHP